jgi:hypothetical protein
MIDVFVALAAFFDGFAEDLTRKATDENTVDGRAAGPTANLQKIDHLNWLADDFKMLALKMRSMDNE